MVQTWATDYQIDECDDIDLEEYIFDYCMERYYEGYDFIDHLNIDLFIMQKRIYTFADAAITLDEAADEWERIHPCDEELW